MIAWLTRLLLVLQAAAAIGIYLLLTHKAGLQSQALAALLSVALVLGVRLIIVLNNFLLAARFRSPLPAQFRLNWHQRVAMFFGEARATLTASSWHMPFRRFRKRPAATTRSLPVLLIHGYGCNSGYWQPMSQALCAAEITHYAVDMEPIFGSIDEYVAHIHEAVEEVCRGTGKQRIVIVAHSMGGLAARAYLQQHGGDRVAKVVTLGTPHHGTALAQFGIGINTQEMLWLATEQEGLASEWLRRLAETENPDIYQLFVSIYSHHDNIISPQTSSHLQGARNVELHGIGHVALAPHPAVQKLVIQEIMSVY